MWLNDNMSWTFSKRSTLANNSVALTKNSLDALFAQYDNFFDFFKPDSGLLTSIKLYPFKLPLVDVNEKHVLSIANYFYEADPASPTTKVRAEKISSSIVYMNLGQHRIPWHFYSFLDYKGYTYIKIYIPYIGYVDVDVNECIGKYMQFRICVDVYTGQALFIIGVSDREITHFDNKYPLFSEDDEMRIIQTFEGNLGIDIPFGSSNLGDIQRNFAIGAVKTVASVYSGVALSSMPTEYSYSKRNVSGVVQNRGTEKHSRLKPTSTMNVTETYESAQYNPYQQSRPFSEAFNTSLDILNNIHSSGESDRSSSANMLNFLEEKVHILIYRPKVDDYFNLPTYKKLYGMPLYSLYNLGDLGGYTKISNIRLEGEYFKEATTTEIQMLYDAIYNGIIL